MLAVIRGIQKANKLTKSLLDVTVDGELTSSDTTNHDKTSRKTSESTTQTELTSDLDETANGTLTRGSLGLVDLGQHGVSGLGDDGSSETGKETSSKVNTGLSSVGHLRLVELSEDDLRELLESDELGHGVGDPIKRYVSFVLPFCFRPSKAFWLFLGINVLLKEDRSETTVEGTDTLVLEDLAETTDEAVGEAGGGDETNTGSLERAKGNGSEELGSGGRDGVDGSAVLAGILNTDAVDGLSLEELVTTELEGTLGEVTSEGRTGTGQESTSTLILDDLAESAEHALVVGGRVELDLGLDAGGLSVEKPTY